MAQKTKFSPDPGGVASDEAGPLAPTGGPAEARPGPARVPDGALPQPAEPPTPGRSSDPPEGLAVTERRPATTPPAAPAEGEGADAGPRRSFEEWAAQAKLDDATAEGVKYRAKWGIGQQVTEAQFKQAVEDFSRVEIG